MHRIEEVTPPTLSAPDAGSTWTRRFWWWLAVSLLVRLAFIVFSPLDLAPDEAYYWDWSRRLAWGYFSKPPLVAWLIALSTSLGGTTSFTVRLPAAVLMTLTTGTLFVWARRRYDARTAFWAAVILSLTPAGVALGALMTPDAPLLFFWTLALYLLGRALESQDRPGAWWLGVGLAVGLGLLSKQTMLAFPVLTGAVLLAGSSFRHHLRRPGPYLGLGLALLFLGPVLGWNQGHHWITFWHTTHHFQPSFQGLLSAPAGVALFVGGQLLIFSPLVWLLMVAVGGRMSWPRAEGRDGRVLMLVVFGFWPLLGVLGLSLWQPVNPNWPAVFYPAGMVLLAAWAGGRPPAGSPAASVHAGRGRRRRLCSNNLQPALRLPSARPDRGPDRHHGPAARLARTGAGHRKGPGRVAPATRDLPPGPPPPGGQ